MSKLPDTLRLQSVVPCSGEVTLPGSKSIANRALLLAALCRQPVVLHNMLRSDDTARMMDALNALGVGLTVDNHTQVTVAGCGGRWKPQQQVLQLGNAGTAMRPLLAVLAATLNDDQQLRLDGDPRMRERPVKDLVDSLAQQQAGISYLGQQGYPPVEVCGGLQAGHFSIDGSVSSQFISALLIALPLLAGDSSLTLTGNIVSRPYIDLTLAMLDDFGVRIDTVSEQEFFIPGKQSLRSPGDYFVEGDASGASYWMAAAAISGGSLTIKGVGKDSIQGDVDFTEVVSRMGADVEFFANAIRVTGGQPLQAIDFDGNAIPDASMTLAPLALFAKGTTAIRNVANWRVKETDRLAAMATELRKTGATVEEGSDYLLITPPERWQHATVDTYDDHRMAMCFALASFSPAGVSINDPACCAKTYPQFFSEFSRLCHLT
ncbi:3-phosphoshikimate 1-carboxyvinyltransferase [Idiomarina seosinensis]|uniref:3-phosphoshikimate 1-carboxyvinyltransferase n=1 Tax=Idiomarina seosinensis TaxID=281739 RepID=UPI003851241F